MDSQTSTVHAELSDITIPAKVESNRNITDNNVRFNTDCRQALLSLNIPGMTSRLILKCHHSLKEAAQGNVVTINWF